MLAFFTSKAVVRYFTDLNGAFFTEETRRRLIELGRYQFPREVLLLLTAIYNATPAAARDVRMLSFAQACSKRSNGIAGVFSNLDPDRPQDACEAF